MKLVYGETDWLKLTKEQRREQTRITLASLLGEEVGKIRIRSSIRNNTTKRYVVYKVLKGRNEEEIAEFKLTPLKGCRGVAISHGVAISEKYRGKGLGQFLNFWRRVQAMLNHYTVVVCTTVHDNAPQNHILNKNGWRQLGNFYNSRTENEVLVWAFNLNEPTEDQKHVESKEITMVYPAFIDASSLGGEDSEVVTIESTDTKVVYKKVPTLPKMNWFQRFVCRLIGLKLN